VILSPASKATESRAPLNSFVEQIRNLTDCKIFLFDEKLSEENISDSFKNTEISTPEDILRNLTISLPCGGDYIPAEQPDFNLLESMTESAFQTEYLHDWCLRPQNHAVDTSSTGKELPSFMLPQKVQNQGTSIYFLSGKPDASSVIFPATIELKSDRKSFKSLASVDWKVLLQATDIVVNSNAFFCLSVSFAIITNRTAWLIVCSRTADNDLGLINLQFWRIRHDSFSNLWGVINYRCRENPSLFMTDDGPPIIDCLRRANFDPMACRVKLHAVSTSKVYTVSTPSLFSSSIGVDSSVKNFVIKIVNTDEEYTSESEALTALFSQSVQESFDFYAKGVRHFSETGLY